MNAIELGMYVDGMNQSEAYKILILGQGAALPNASDAAWDRMVDRTLPAPKADETFLRYEGVPVRAAELKAALADRWGDRFTTD